MVAGKWVAAVLLVVVVVGKWAEHASVSSQPVSLSARTLVELHQQPRKLLEDMDDDYPADAMLDRLADEGKPNSGMGCTHPTDLKRQKR